MINQQTNAKRGRDDRGTTAGSIRRRTDNRLGKRGQQRERKKTATRQQRREKERKEYASRQGIILQAWPCRQHTLLFRPFLSIALKYRVPPCLLPSLRASPTSVVAFSTGPNIRAQQTSRDLFYGISEPKKKSRVMLEERGREEGGESRKAASAVKASKVGWSQCGKRGNSSRE